MQLVPALAVDDRDDDPHEHQHDPCPVFEQHGVPDQQPEQGGHRRVGGEQDGGTARTNPRQRAVEQGIAEEDTDQPGQAQDPEAEDIDPQAAILHRDPRGKGDQAQRHHRQPQPVEADTAQRPCRTGRQQRGQRPQNRDGEGQQSAFVDGTHQTYPILTQRLTQRNHVRGREKAYNACPHGLKPLGRVRYQRAREH